MSPKNSGGLKLASQPSLLESVQKRFEKDVFASAASKYMRSEQDICFVNS